MKDMNTTFRNGNPEVKKVLGTYWHRTEDNIKKFWEELIVYFPLLRHGPHRKQFMGHTQQLGDAPNKPNDLIDWDVI
jgi:hypothetical protein